MNITELRIIGYDDAAILFATTLTADEARVMKPGTGEEGEPVVGQARQKAIEAFAVIRDLMDDIICTPGPSC